MYSLDSYEEYFKAGAALDATWVAGAAGRDVSLITTNAGAPLPDAFVVRSSQDCVGMLRVGGTTGARPDEVVGLFTDTARMIGGDTERYPFKWFRDGIMSGGTRGTDGDLLTPTAHWTCCEVPGMIWTAAQQYTDDPDQLPLTSGTTPRTSEALGYGGKYSTISLDEAGGRKTIFNPFQHVELVVQVDPTVPGTWALDLPLFVAMLKLFRRSRRGLSGHMSIGGGGVTAEELARCLKDKLPCLVLNGTSRVGDWAADLIDGKMHPEAAKNDSVREQFEVILALPAEHRQLITVVDRTDALAGQQWFQRMGLGQIL